MRKHEVRHHGLLHKDLHGYGDKFAEGTMHHCSIEALRTQMKVYIVQNTIRCRRVRAARHHERSG